MQDKLSDLIKILLKSESSVVGKKLAAQLHVSARTIRNYVHEINGLSDNNIISASNNGYYIIDKLAATELLRIKQEVGSHIPQNNEDRFTYIVQKLLRNNFLDSFSLANELYISYATLKRTINYINKRLNQWKIRIISSHDQLSLSGKESNKRQLFSYLIYRESTGNLLNSNYLEKSFGKKISSELQSMTDRVIKKYGLQLNEFSYNNLLLHLLILVSRLSIGKTITQQVSESDNTLGKYTIDLAKSIKETFSANITPSEIQEIDVLFKSNANLYSEISNQKYFDKSFMKNIEKIIEKVENMYLVDLSSDKFVQPFSIHTYNLLYRLKHNLAIHNPIKTDISNNFPLIYDIATYVAFQINEIWHFKVSEDEISFIALHIGAEIERQKQAPQKLKAEIVVPRYLNIKEQVHDFFRRNFTKDIAIVKETEKIDSEDSNISYDIIFLIMFPNEKEQISSKYIQLNPFELNKQKTKIQTVIDETSLRMKKEAFKQKSLPFFTDRLFWNIDDKCSQAEVTKNVCKEMKSLNIVNSSFYPEIMQREAMGSTAFNKIAIIHPMSYNSLKTMVAVVLSKNGIKWDGKVVNMVFIISISKQYKDEFRIIYENLMDFLSNEETFNRVLESKTIDDFYKSLLS